MQRDLPRHRQAVLPAQRRGGVGVVGVGDAHPADQDAPPVRRPERLGRVKVKAHVPLGKAVQAALGQVAVHGKMAALVDVLAGIGPVGQPLGRQAEEALPVQLKIIGALPHVAKGRLLFQHGFQLPAQAVGAAVQQHPPRVAAAARPQHHAPALRRAPDLGVAHVAAAVGGIIAVGQKQPLWAHGAAVRRLDAEGVALPPGGDIIIITGVLDIAGVVQPQRAAVRRRAAGVYAVRVPRMVGRQRHAGKGPVQKIGAFVMAPAFGAAAVRRQGAVLKIDVVPPAEPAQAVGIVQPAARGFQMERLTPFSHGSPSPFCRRGRSAW